MTTGQNDHQGGHTPLNPPPPSVPQPPAPAAAVSSDTAGAARAKTGSARTPGATAILTVTAVIGGIALLSSGGTAAVAATGDLVSASRPDSVQTVDVDGVERLRLDADASAMRVEFADVDEAELSITNGRGPAWTFERDGDELVVKTPETRWGWWFGNWFGDEEVAVLTLPESLGGSGFDADLSLDAGSLDVSGDFGALDLQVNAGALDVEGSAESLDADMSAGRADILLADVSDAVLGVAAGDLTVELTGTAPTNTSIDVSAGSLDLTLPDEEYLITQDVSAGSLDATVDQSGDGRRTIEVSLAAGSATIRPGR